jgi:cholesterol oxidase
VMVEGRSSYIKFQRRHGPELQPPVADSRHPLWYPFRVNGYALFMTDTRTERTWRTAGGIPTSKIMSNGQCEALLAWLDQQGDDDRPKVIASPAILLPRHARAIQRGSVASALRSDSWDGYPLTLYTLLAHIASHEIRNVVFVSGDEHISCVARAELETKGHPPVVVHSVHSSPLYAPFPFANSERADLVASDDFTFASEESERVSCHVQAEFGPPGDGYSVLRFTRARGGWTMQCRFDRAAGGSATIVRKLY